MTARQVLVKAEAVGCSGMPLGEALDTPNHKSGHLAKDAIWTPTRGGPLPTAGGKNFDSHHPAPDLGCTTGRSERPDAGHDCSRLA